jgi:hypothetical protein
MVLWSEAPRKLQIQGFGWRAMPALRDLVERGIQIDSQRRDVGFSLPCRHPALHIVDQCHAHEFERRDLKADVRSVR